MCRQRVAALLAGKTSRAGQQALGATTLPTIPREWREARNELAISVLANLEEGKCLIITRPSEYVTKRRLRTGTWLYRAPEPHMRGEADQGALSNKQGRHLVRFSSRTTTCSWDAGKRSSSPSPWLCFRHKDGWTRAWGSQTQQKPWKSRFP